MHHHLLQPIPPQHHRILIEAVNKILAKVMDKIESYNLNLPLLKILLRTSRGPVFVAEFANIMHAIGYQKRLWKFSTSRDQFGICIAAQITTSIDFEDPFPSRLSPTANRAFGYWTYQEIDHLISVSVKFGVAYIAGREYGRCVMECFQ